MAGPMRNKAVATVTIVLLGAACEDDAGPARTADAAGGGGLDATAEGGVKLDAAADLGWSLDGHADLVVDASDDRPPLPGVSCVTKQSVPRDGGFCSQTTTTEPDVGFWRAMVNLEAHWDAALRTDSEGIHRFFGTTTDNQRPQFYATDGTFTLYQVREMMVPGMDSGTVRRTGDRLDFTMNVRRGDVAGGSCADPALEITCSGSTWLRQ
jgi:hypothetical protein